MRTVNNTNLAASFINAEGIREFHVYNLQPSADIQAPSGTENILLITTHSSDPYSMDLPQVSGGYVATTFDGDLHIGSAELSFNEPEKRENISFIFKHFPVDILNEFDVIGIVAQDRLEFIDSIHFIDRVSRCAIV